MPCRTICDRHGYQCDSCVCGECADDLKKMIQALEAERDELKAALWNLGDHSKYCNISVCIRGPGTVKGGCTCGFSDLVEKYRLGSRCQRIHVAFDGEGDVQTDCTRFATRQFEGLPLCDECAESYDAEGLATDPGKGD